MAKTDDLEWFQPETRADWRRWLDVEHRTSPGVWVVTWRKAAGRAAAVTYDDVVEEGLAYGWIDAKGGKVDDDRTRLLMTPRKVGSNWSGLNKARVERLTAAGLMTDAGRRAVERAQADGSWTRLDEVEQLIVSDDLAAAFDRYPGSRDRWDAFAPSARKAVLTWLVSAKAAATRDKRVDEIARLAAAGQLANSRPRT